MPTLDGRSPGFPVGPTAEWDGRRITRTYDDQYQVTADNQTQLGKTIVDFLQIPVGDPFSEDPVARAIRVGPAKRSEVNRLVWLVPIHYTTQFSDDDADDAPKRPDQRRQKKRWTYETMQVPFTHDAVTSSKPVTNSADEPFEDLTDFVIPVMTVERFEVGFDENRILDFANHTNDSAFFGAPAKTVLCAGIEADDDGGSETGNEVHDGILYQRVRYVFKFKIPITDDNKGWVARYVDEGTRYKSGTTYLPYLSDADPTVGKRERIVGNLDGSGAKLTVGNALVFLQFNKHPEADFNSLGIM